MLKRTMAIVVSGMLLSLTFGFSSVRAQTAKEDQAAAKMRSQVLKLGTGPRARVEAKLRDKTTLKGYVSAADDNSFTVTDSNTGAAQTVAYTDVAKVKKPGGLSTKSWIIIGAAAAGAVITWIVVKPAFCDGGAQTKFPC